MLQSFKTKQNKKDTKRNNQDPKAETQGRLKTINSYNDPSNRRERLVIGSFTPSF